MRRYQITRQGLFRADNGEKFVIGAISDREVYVGHLQPHILTITLPAGEQCKIIVFYSSHCWTRKFDPQTHAGHMKIMDGRQARVFCPDRFEASKALPGLLANLTENRVYLTRTDRNYGSYRVSEIRDDGRAYTAYFTVRRDKGRFNGIRHKLRLFVESAYNRDQPEPGQNVKITTIVSKALRGEKVKYFRR